MTLRPITASILFLCAALLAAPAPAQDDGRPAAGTGWLGVLLGEVRPTAAPEEGSSLPDNPLDRPNGIRVRRVMQDGPAMRAGLRAGDIILEADGRPLESTSDLIRAISGQDRGSWISLRIDRRGKEREIRARLDGRPENTSGLNYREGYAGIRAIDLPETLKTHFGAPEGAGVMISQVDDGSPGHVAGLELGDVVFEVDGTPVGSAGRLREMLAGGGVGNSLEIRAMRSGVEIVVEAAIVDVPEEVRERNEQLIQERRNRRSQGQQRRNTRD